MEEIQKKKKKIHFRTLRVAYVEGIQINYGLKFVLTSTQVKHHHHEVYLKISEKKDEEDNMFDAY